MPAPARPKVGAFSTAHLIDMYAISRTLPGLAFVAQAPTRPGAGIFSNHGGCSELPYLYRH